MSTGHELEGKQPIPVDELQAIMANTEKMCVLQLLLQPGEELMAKDVNSRFAQAQEPAGMVEYKSINTLQRNIIDSHSMAGTFVVSQNPSMKTWQAKKAVDSDVADSLAGHNLGLSARYGLSLEDFWGKTAKVPEYGLRAPQTRLRIFERLSGLRPAEVVSIPRLAASLGFTSRLIHSHLQRLYSFGFIEYSATELEKQTITFEIVGDPDPTKSTLTQRGERVLNYPNYAGAPSDRTLLGKKLMEFRQAGKTTFSYDDIIDKEGDDSGSKLPLGAANMNLLLMVMVREGTLKRHHKSTTTGDQFSEAYVDEQQKKIIDRVVRFHRGLRDNDPDIIQEGLKLAAAVMKDKKLVAELLQRDYDHSSQINRQSYEQRAASVGSLLVGYDVELSTREIQQRLDEGALTINSVGGILRKMRARGKVTGRKIGNEQYWRLDT